MLILGIQLILAGNYGAFVIMPEKLVNLWQKEIIPTNHNSPGYTFPIKRTSSHSPQIPASSFL